eukprot:TRINITY_DN17249_c0_g1_i2.p1 TRINITY_DN17249_c0_g1~~TRINITY_DN17249_c0_g1_i2.p1  ORF type:complete len:515 (+),score=171.65 TRINITY_DN17249_c0_g1_i2:88-1545(+)
MRLPCAALLAAAAGPYSAALGASDVAQLGSGSLPRKAQAEELLLVQFVAPWCAHCKEAAADWEQAAAALRGVAVLGRVDGAAEGELTRLHGVTGFPAVKVWQGGKGPADYKGSRRARDIIDYATRLSGPAVREYADAAELERGKRTHKVLVCLFAEDNAAESAPFAAVAERHREELAFARVGKAAVAEFAAVKPPAVMVYTDKGGGGAAGQEFLFPGGAEAIADELIPFVRNSTYQALPEITPHNYEELRAGGGPLVWAFTDAAAAAPAALAPVAEAAAVLRGNASFGWISGPKNLRIAARMGLTGRKWPALSMEQGGSHYTHAEGGSLSAAGIADWVRAVLDGSASPTLKSEDPPDPATVGGLTTLVGSTFNATVYDKTKDVLVLFHAPWCGHCKAMTPAYGEVAQRLAAQEAVVIAQMDVSANDPPRAFEIRGFPTIALVMGETNEVVLYEGPRTADAMLRFLQSTAHSKPVPEEAAAGGSEL